MFGLSIAALQKECTEKPEIKETCATTASYIYVMNASTWNSGGVSEANLKANYIWFNNQSTPGSTISSLCTSDPTNNYVFKHPLIPSMYVARIKVPSGATYCRVNDGYIRDTGVETHRQTMRMAIPDSASNLNLLVVNSDRSNYADQRAFWSTLNGDNTNWGVDTDTLYFVPNRTWTENNQEYGDVCWPVAEITFNDGSVYDYPADGIDELDTSSLASNSNRVFVFTFHNVPIKPIKTMYYYHHKSGSTNYTSVWLKLKTGAINAWCTVDPETGAKSHTANIFGFNDNSYGDEKDGKYELLIGSDSNAYLYGSFAEDSNIAYRDNPTLNTILTFDNVSNKYTKTVDVDAEDSFLIDIIRLDNTSASSQPSTWTYDSEPYSFTNTNITVIFNGSPVDESEIGDYIYNDSGYICFVRGGTVEFSRMSNDKFNNELTISFLNSSSRIPTGTTFEPSLITGTINDNIIDADVSYSDIQYNPTTGRYELYVAAIASDTYTYKADEETSAVKSASVITTLSNGQPTADILIEDGDNDDLVIIATGYYIIGWYPYNSTPTGASGNKGYVYFIDQLTTYNEACANALAKRILACQFCSLTRGDASALATLYGNLSGVATRDTILSNFSYKDYDQLAYRNNHDSYDGISRATSINAKTKYNHIQTIASSLPAEANRLGGLSNLNNEDSTVATVIIFLSCASLLGFSLTSMMVIKKKKRITK